MREIDELVQTVAALRDPDDGCPWDLRQTHKSLTPYLVEEAYEAVDSILHGAPENIAEELGDVLLQVVLHARIASESGEFDLADIATTLNQKMIRRHPHVFAGVEFANDADYKAFWEAEKQREKGDSLSRDAQRYPHLPAILAAVKIQKDAARVGFDWQNASGVVDKIREELTEVDAELNKLGANDDVGRSALQGELGDLLFSVINLARFTGVDPEAALRQTNEKFTRRFDAVRERIESEGQEMSKTDLDLLESYWQQVKRDELA